MPIPSLAYLQNLKTTTVQTKSPAVPLEKKALRSRDGKHEVDKVEPSIARGKNKNDSLN